MEQTNNNRQVRFKKNKKQKQMCREKYAEMSVKIKSEKLNF